MPKHETRFNADAWIQVWVTEDELREDPEIQRIRQNEASNEIKIERIQGRASEIAQDKLNLAILGRGVEASNDTFDIDSEFNHIDWESLL